MSFGPEWYVPDFSHLFWFLDILLGDNCHDRYEPNVLQTLCGNHLDSLVDWTILLIFNRIPA